MGPTSSQLERDTSMRYAGILQECCVVKHNHWLLLYTYLYITFMDVYTISNNDRTSFILVAATEFSIQQPFGKEFYAGNDFHLHSLKIHSSQGTSPYPTVGEKKHVIFKLALEGCKMSSPFQRLNSEDSKLMENSDH